MAKFRSWNEELQAFIYFEDGEFTKEFAWRCKNERKKRNTIFSNYR